MSIQPYIRSTTLFSIRVLGLAVISGAVLAHPGHEAADSLLLSGFVHPLTGFDHLFAMLAVGLWSALAYSTIRQAIWTPISFLCLLLIGALLGLSQISVPAIEPIIMSSLLVLGLLIATRFSMPSGIGAFVVGFFALFHGMAHGSWLPETTGAAPFIIGFMLTTFALLLSGLAIGLLLKKHNRWLTRLTGAGIAAYGVSLLATLA